MATDPQRVDAGELAHIYQRRIRVDLLDGIPRSASPTAVLVGGQPGAGRSFAAARVRAHLATSIGPAVVVSGDDLLGYHPWWRSQGQPGAQAGARADIRQWVAALVADTVAQGSNLIVESGMRRPDAVLALAGQLRASGCAVSAVVLAAERDGSRLAAMARYDLGRAAGEIPRLVSAAEHDGAFEGLRDTLQRLEARQAVDRLQVVARDGRQLYANALANGRWAREPKALAVLDDFRERRLTARELADSALRWMVVAQRLAGDPAVPRELATQAVAWRNEAVARAGQDPQAARLLESGREAECWRTMERQQFLREFPQHAKAVQRLDEAVKYAQENFAHAHERERFVAQARQRLAERIAEGRFGTPNRTQERSR